MGAELATTDWTKNGKKWRICYQVEEDEEPVGGSGNGQGPSRLPLPPEAKVSPPGSRSFSAL